MKMAGAARLAALAGLVVALWACDALEQVTGVDSVKRVERDNPVDKASTTRLVFGLDAPTSVVATLRPTFLFSLLPALPRYDLQLATNPDFAAPLANDESHIAEARHKIAGTLVNHGRYWWRVRPRYSNGAPGPWTDPVSFSVELPVASASLAPVANSLYPSVSFTPHSAIASYSLQVSSRSDPSSVFLIDETGIQTSLFPLAPVLSNHGSYFWRVRPRYREDGEGDWTEFRPFTLEFPSLAATLPAVSPTAHPVLLCTLTPLIPSYSVQIDDAADFATPLVDQTGLTETAHPVVAAFANHGNYFWRVKPLYVDGSAGDWSPSRSLSVVLPVPQLSSPGAGAKLTTPVPTFSWLSSSGMTGYEVQVALDEVFTAPVSVRTTELNAINPTPANDGEVLYWRVRCWEGVVAGDWSPSRSHLVSVAAPLLELPVSGQANHSPTFVWNYGAASPSPSALKGFQITLSSAPDFLSADTQELMVGPSAYSNGRVTYSAFPTLVPLTTYYWKSRTDFGAGVFGPWSATATFLRDRVSQVIPVKDFRDQLLADDGTLRIISSTTASSMTKTGALLWEVPVDGTAQFVLGADGTLYQVGSKVVAFSASGQKKWEYSLPFLGSVGPPALGNDGTLYVLDKRYNLGSTLFALGADGTLKWSFVVPVEEPANASAPWVTACGPVILSGSQIVFGEGDHLYALSSSGGLLWTHRFASATAWVDVLAGASGNLIVNRERSDDFIKEMLTFRPSGSTVSAPEVSLTAQLVTSTGSVFGELWGDWTNTDWFVQKKPGMGPQMLAVDHYGSTAVLGVDQTLYFSNWYDVRAIRPSDGVVLWTCGFEGDVRGLALDSSGMLYVHTANGVAVIPTTSLGIDTSSPWPMGDHDPRSSRNAAP